MVLSRCLFWLSVVSLLLASSVHAADVLLTAIEDSPGIRAFTAELSKRRPQDQVHFRLLADLPVPGRLPDATRLILLDGPSLDWRLQEARGPSTLVMRISRIQARQRLGSYRPGRLSLLWSDPPLSRQVNLARMILPAARRIGVLYGRNSAFLLDELRKAAAPLGLEIVTQFWTDTTDNHAVQTLLGECDVLLGLDDADLYNPKTAKSLLLSSYAGKRALIGPNAAFVKAGSLASTYSDQADWLAIVDDLLDRPPASWPRTLYPNRFKVASNAQVARSLDIEPIDELAVANALAKGETRP
ncbi:ABC transporter substrate-binding protein [Pseudomonas akapageensis]|uniref:ABC transporter substrate-binding protein n=1 Tax=Pseudomonas akapageensis TaxID=2609961 RepID=UPI00140798FD|nr:ABC transporter substrate-binding protein [Pseudomonas akapageensis]